MLRTKPLISPLLCKLNIATRKARQNEGLLILLRTFGNSFPISASICFGAKTIYQVVILVYKYILVIRCRVRKIFHMEKQTRSVRFSPIEDEACDESSNVGSEFNLVLEGITLEEVYVGSLFENEKKHHLSKEGAKAIQRGLRRHKRAVLSLGFVLLLGVGCVAIYLTVMELYNHGYTPYSRQLGLKNSAPTAESTTIEISTSPLISDKIVQSIKGNILIVFYRERYSGKATLSFFFYFFFLPQKKDCFWDSVKDNKYQKGYHNFCGHHLLLLLILLL